MVEAARARRARADGRPPARVPPGRRAAQASSSTSGELGDIHYIYSNRLNLGQAARRTRTRSGRWARTTSRWSCGSPARSPTSAARSARATCSAGVEDVVFCFLRFPSGLAAHLHLSWLDPHKERRFTVVGSKRMATFDDMELERKLTVYDKGFDEDYSSYGEYIARSGDIYSPRDPERGAAADRVRALHRVRARRRRAALGRRGGAARGAGAGGAAALAARRARVPPALSSDSTARRGCCSARASSCRTTWRSAATWWCTPARVIGAGARLQDGCVVGKPVALGQRSTRRRRGARRRRVIGAGATVGAGAVVLAGRRDRRAAAWSRDQAHVRERDVDRRRVAWWAAAPRWRTTCAIGARVRMQTGAYMTAWSVVEDDVFVAPGRGRSRTTRPRAGARPARSCAGRRCGAPAASAAGAVLLPGVEVGEEAFVAAGAVVTRDVPARRGRDGRAGAGGARGAGGGAARAGAGAPAPRHRGDAGARRRWRLRRGGGRGWRGRPGLAARLGAAAERDRPACCWPPRRRWPRRRRWRARATARSPTRENAMFNLLTSFAGTFLAGARGHLRAARRGRTVGPVPQPARRAAPHPPLRAGHRDRVRRRAPRRSSRATSELEPKLAVPFGDRDGPDARRVGAAARARGRLLDARGPAERADHAGGDGAARRARAGAALPAPRRAGRARAGRARRRRWFDCAPWRPPPTA